MLNAAPVLNCSGTLSTPLRHWKQFSEHLSLSCTVEYFLKAAQSTRGCPGLEDFSEEIKLNPGAQFKKARVKYG